MSDALLIGGFHAVQAALDDGAEKPRQIWLLDSRQDERARRILAAAQTHQVPVARLGRGELDLKCPGLRHQGVVAELAPQPFVGEDALYRPATPERLPVIAVTNLSRTLERLQTLGYWITGLAGEATVSVFDADFRGPTVLVMGAEGEGMRRLTREHCDHLVKIPMVGKVESLNVSVATAVCLFEVVRQRSRR